MGGISGLPIPTNIFRNMFTQWNRPIGEAETVKEALPSSDAIGEGLLLRDSLRHHVGGGRLGRGDARLKTKGWALGARYSRGSEVIFPCFVRRLVPCLGGYLLLSAASSIQIACAVARSYVWGRRSETGSCSAITQRYGRLWISLMQVVIELSNPICSLIPAIHSLRF